MPERILYYDCAAGISGDMHLGALVDLGLPLEHLEGELRKLGLEGWRLLCVRDSRKGISGTRLKVELDESVATTPAQPAALSHSHGPGSVPHVHSHGDGVEHSHAYEHRRHSEIVALIQASGLSDAVKRRSLAIFARLAEAEGKIHGMPPEEVAFHEVGAVDSIVDIVGAAIAIEWFQPDRIYASTVELGSGFVNCMHGRLPVPAPATVEVLKGVPVRRFSVPFEATTPTGAAILSANAHGFTDAMDFTIEKIGYGVGFKDGPLPNVLRVYLASGSASAREAGDLGREQVALLECNLDDMTGEELGHVQELLLKAGAADVWTSPITMKKSRPAVLLSVLVPLEQEQALTRLVLTETSTFGLRRRLVERSVLKRTLEEFRGSLGVVRVKSAWLEGRRLKWKFEYEDLRALAEEKKLPLRTLEERLSAEYENSLSR